MILKSPLLILCYGKRFWVVTGWELGMVTRDPVTVAFYYQNDSREKWFLLSDSNYVWTFFALFTRIVVYLLCFNFDNKKLKA